MNEIRYVHDTPARCMASSADISVPLSSVFMSYLPDRSVGLKQAGITSDTFLSLPSCCGTQCSVLHSGTPGFGSQPSDLGKVVSPFCVS